MSIPGPIVKRETLFLWTASNSSCPSWHPSGPSLSTPACEESNRLLKIVGRNWCYLRCLCVRSTRIHFRISSSKFLPSAVFMNLLYHSGEQEAYNETATWECTYPLPTDAFIRMKSDGEGEWRSFYVCVGAFPGLKINITVTTSHPKSLPLPNTVYKTIRAKDRN